MIQRAHAPRLEAVPEQQILNVSNQVDDTQQRTTYFPSRVSWIDAARAAYCATRGLRGVHYFLPAIPSSQHGFIASSDTFPGATSAGTTLGTWLGGAIDDPGGVADAVEEGTLVARFGARPLGCLVASPSGAFVAAPF